MKEIFEQYGSVIIAAVAISALVAIIVVLLSTDGVVATSFKNLVDEFFKEQQALLQANRAITKLIITQRGDNFPFWKGEQWNVVQSGN